MNYTFNNNMNHHRRKLILVGTAAILCATSMTGCSLKKDKPVDEPSINIIESTPAAETTLPPETTAPKKENMAIVKEKLKPRTSPSIQSPELETEMNAGDEIQIIRIETLNGVQWAYSKMGWIQADLLDLTNVSLTIGSTGTPANPAATEATAATAGTTPESNANNTSTSTTGAKDGVVIASELNVRNQPGTASNVVGSLPYGSRVAISETKDGWGKISNGWISLQHVYLDGTTGNNACKGLITGSGLNVRSGPGTNYGSVATLNKNDRVNVLFRIKIGDYNWGCIDKGWIRMDYVYVDGTEGNNSGDGLIIGDGLNIRSGPGTNYGVVGSYSRNNTVKIYAQFTIGDYNWGCTDKGWIRMDYVQMG